MMRKLSAVIFDLDGTLLDTLEDLAAAVNATLRTMGCESHPVESYKIFIGDGIPELARKVLPKEYRHNGRIEYCVREMQNQYAGRLTERTKPYPGIEHLLESLSSIDIKMAVLSNKPDELTKDMIRYYFKDKYFAIVIGASQKIPHKPDPQGLLFAVERLEANPQECLYVGDSGVDMQTAVSAGCVPIGVLWGFREEKELRKAGAQAIVNDPQSLWRTIQRLSKAE